MPDEITPSSDFFTDVRGILADARRAAYTAVNSAMVGACIPESPQAAPSIRDFIKDPYVLEFLGLPEDPAATETKIESAIISQLQSFLLEMGHGFSFVARQMRVSTETSHKTKNSLNSATGYYPR